MNGKVETLEECRSFSKEDLIFDFNSKGDFSPDADSVKVARKFWRWLLNPLNMPMFKEKQDKCIYIQRPSRDKAEDDDSYGSESEEEGFSYQQPEAMDNLVDI